MSHRLPKQSYRDVVREGSQASSNSRLRAPNIVVKFVRRKLRDRFYKVRKFLRDKTTEDVDLGLHSGNKIYISENLTQINKDRFKDSLKVKKFNKLNLLKLQDHIKLQTLFFMHQFNTGKLLKIFESFFVKTSCKHNVNTRFASRSTFYLPKIRTNYGKFNIRFNGPKLWNELDERFKCRTSNQFKKELTSHFISLY